MNIRRYIVTLDESAISMGMQLASTLRDKCCLSVFTETLQRSMRSQMREANRLKARYFIIIGENELNTSIFPIKDMSDGTQDEIPLDNISNYFLDK